MELELSRNDISQIEKICNVIDKNKSFLITAHQNLDGDAISSELAMFLLLKKLNKKVRIINWDKVPSIYRFLPSIKEVKIYDKEKFRNNFDVVIVLDCGSLERIVDISNYVKDLMLINIDHHLTNSHFGKINWVNPEFSATGEMIYFIIRKLNNIDKKIATCIYTAILTDTGRFTYRVSKFTMDIVKDLLTYKISPVEIGRKIYLEKPFKSIKLLSEALNNLKFNPINRVCWMKITKQLYKKTKTDETYTEGFSEFLSEIKEAEVIFLIKEKENGTKVSLRSKGKFDVEKLARKFGGGGHREAAGCFFKNLDVESVEKIILKEIKENGRNYKCK